MLFAIMFLMLVFAYLFLISWVRKVLKCIYSHKSNRYVIYHFYLYFDISTNIINNYMYINIYIYIYIFIYI